MLRLNMLVPPARKPKRLAVLKGDFAGFPNGRRLTDDVVDIEERVAAGVLVPGFDIKPNKQLGDGVDVNDVPLLPYFPYVALPHDPFDHSHDGDDQEADKARFTSGGSSTAGGLLPNAGDDDEDVEEPGTGRGGDVGPADKAVPAAAGLEAGPTGSGSLRFSVPRVAHVTLAVYDARGRKLRTLVDQDAAAGSFEARWNGRDDGGAAVGKGVYFAQFALDGQVVESRKLVVMN
jgi:hypothetical protein